MTTDILERPQPLVLVVEDEPDSLRLRLELFESRGCTAIGAGSRREALRELRASPGVDLLVTDINMPEDGDDDDKSGVDLAREVRASFPMLPIAGYSAHFAEDQLSSRELEIFDVSFAKGRQRTSELRRQVEQCVALAQGHRETRLAQAEEELERLRRKHEVALPEAEVVRRLAPDGQAVVEAALQRAGYMLRLITSSSVGIIREPFAIWLVKAADGWEGEVYGYPELYAWGDTEEDVASSLLELMALFHEDLVTSEEPNSPRVARLANFLERVLGGQES